MRRRLLAAAVAALATSPWLAPAACASFLASVGTSGTSFASYSVPAPANIRCSGLSSLTSSKILWDAVVTFYALPALSLASGRYAVQAQISSGWRSSATTITVSVGVLGLYTCSTP